MLLLLFCRPAVIPTRQHPRLTNQPSKPRVLLLDVREACQNGKYCFWYSQIVAPTHLYLLAKSVGKYTTENVCLDCNYHFFIASPNIRPSGSQLLHGLLWPSSGKFVVSEECLIVIKHILAKTDFSHVHLEFKRLTDPLLYLLDVPLHRRRVVRGRQGSHL